MAHPFGRYLVVIAVVAAAVAYAAARGWLGF